MDGLKEATSNVVDPADLICGTSCVPPSFLPHGVQRRKKEMKKFAVAIATTGLICSAGLAQDTLWDNGPLLTHEGGGFGGADASRLQNSSLGMTTLGNNRNLGSFSSADNFVVGPEGWILDSIITFGYQTNSGNTSTMTGLFVRIWDASPDQAGANIVWGDFTTNIMSSTSWTGMYRESETSTPSTARPIMDLVGLFGGLVLSQGEYWVEVSMTGSTASGPWMPPVTILGETTTGNAISFSESTQTWSDWVDTGTQTQQGMPFILTGSLVPAPGAIALLGLAGVCGVSRRRRA